MEDVGVTGTIPSHHVNYVYLVSLSSRVSLSDETKHRENKRKGLLPFGATIRSILLECSLWRSPSILVPFCLSLCIDYYNEIGNVSPRNCIPFVLDSARAAFVFSTT